MDNKTFLLGVGAQKSGTTWVSNYIQSFSEVDTGFTKEYHIWDALTHEECKRYNTPVYKIRSANNFKRWKMLRNNAFYFDYFASVLARPDVTMTADITPSYSCLSASTLNTIRQGFEKRNINVKVVFLMRDPFERCWSAVRHYKRNESRKDGVNISAKDGEALRDYVHSENCAIRTRYEKTISEIESAFSPDEVFYGIYEELFSDNSIIKLSEFLQLASRLELSNTRVNVSAKSEDVPNELIKMVRDIYSETYEFCGEKFPQVKSLWTGFGV